MCNKIKIFRVFSRLAIGGPSIHTILLTAGLNKRKFQSILVTGNESKSEGSMMDLAFSKNVAPIIVPEMSREISFKKDIIALIKITRLIRKFKPDIIHTHTAKAGFLGRTAVLIYNLIYNDTINHKSSPIKVFHTFHGNTFTGYFGKIKSSLFIFIEKFLARFTTQIICITELQKKEIIDLGISKLNHVVTIPLGLELNKFFSLNENLGSLRSELGIDDKTILVGIIARLVPIKNHMMFLKSIIDLRRNNNDLKVKALIIGDGDCRVELERFVEKKGLNNLVIFLGFRNDIDHIYADLDIVTLTSNNEGSPVALIEAMACNIPIITTNVGGIDDLMGGKRSEINPGEFQMLGCGIVVNPEDQIGFSKAMKFLIDNPEVRSQLGSKGKKMVYPQYDISRLINDIEILYSPNPGKNPI